MKKKPTYAQLKRKLDKVFSAYIRKRDAEMPCISCGKYVDSKDAGHYHSRRILSTRWDPINVNGQCRNCNRFLEGMKDDYRQGIIDKYGEMELLKLNDRAKIQVKLNAEDLNGKIKFWEAQ